VKNRDIFDVTRRTDLLYARRGDLGVAFGSQKEKGEIVVNEFLQDDAHHH